MNDANVHATTELRNLAFAGFAGVPPNDLSGHAFSYLGRSWMREASTSSSDLWFKV